MRSTLAPNPCDSALPAPFELPPVLVGLGCVAVDAAVSDEDDVVRSLEVAELVGSPMVETTLVRVIVAGGTPPVVDRVAGGGSVVLACTVRSTTPNKPLISLSSPSIDTASN